MAEASSLIPASVLRNLIDKLYEKRKNAAVTVSIQDIVGKLAYELEVKKILAVINMLATEFSSHPQPDCRKSLPTFYLWFCFLQGGLIGLAAVAVGLKEKAPAYLEEIVQPILHRIADEDSTVRYIASEALYNVAKTVRGDIISYLDKIFDALCKLSDDSDTSVQNGAQLLDNLLKISDYDRMVKVLVHRASSPDDNTRLTSITWVISFLNDIFSSLLAALSDRSDESLREEDITVKFSVQLDKLIGLLETPIFAFLRLQVFTSRIQTCISMWFAVHLRFFSELAQCIFGQYMCSQIVLSYDFVQRSAAFKIVRTRLKTVPSNIFNNEQLKHPCSQISEITDDSGDQVAANVYDKINFPSKLQQFQQTLSRHRFSLQSQRSASSSTSQVSASFYGFASPLVTRSSVALLVLRVI
ncbi:hypothetical protein BHE74_00040278 [Ensete ventricosum]|nr:hypothetical protein BHE74_00040278 [Ensete ventricosum]